MTELKNQLPIWVLICAISLTVAGLGWTVWSIYNVNYRDAITQEDYQTRLVQIPSEMKYLDEVLSMSIRMAAQTGEPGWLLRYETNKPQLTSVFSQAVALAPNLAVSDNFETVNRANEALLLMEQQVFELVRRGKKQQAQTIVSSTQYEQQKAIYANAMEEVYLELKQHLILERNDRRQSNKLHMIVILLITLSMFAVWANVWLLLKRRNQAMAKSQVELESQKLVLDDHAIVSITNARGDFTYVNKQLCNISGYTQQELIGKSHKMLWSSDHGLAFYSDFRKMIEKGDVWKGELKNKTKQGEPYWVSTTVRPFFDESGTRTHSIAIRSDITKLKKIESELRQSEEKFRSISDSSSVAVIVAMDQKGNFIYWNRAAEIAFGYSANEIIGLPVTTIMPERFHDSHNSGFQRVMKTDETKLVGTTIEIPAKRRNGEEFEIELSLGMWESGNEKFFSAVIHDISERKRIEMELQASIQKALAASLAKSNFLSTMSHEIRTPINGVLGVAQLLGDSDLDQQQHDYVNIILSSGKTLLAIINDVLDMSRIEAGAQELEITTFDFQTTLSTIVMPFQSIADDKGIILNVNNKLGGDISLTGDPVRLRQILWNLFSNAIKFTEQGSVSFSINFEGKTDEDTEDNKRRMIHFRLEDTGKGIAEDRIDAIFSSFTQEDNSISRKFGGTGLGLAIVKQLCELMDGRIEASSELNKGTQFDVYLPFIVGVSNKQEKLPDPLESDDAHQKPLNILLAEDNPVNALICRTFLEKAGHSVRHVENGIEALEVIKENLTDFVLMDIHMPEMNGIDATIAIRELDKCKYLPIIGLTAEAFVERHELFIESGMNAVLTKPFMAPQLHAIIEKYRNPANIKLD